MTLALPIVKRETPPDDPDAVVVWGKATGPELDLDGQIVDPAFARKALSEWFQSFGNIRQMHATTLPPAGKALELEETADGFYVRAKVVEPTAVRLVREGVYQAFSIGVARPRIVRDGTAPNGRIVDGVIVEVSLVDYPANPTCKFVVAKAAEAGVVEGGLVKCACGCRCEPGAPDPTCSCDCATCQAIRDIGIREAAAPAVEKRDFDPNVGGGVDRDKIPDEDFIDPERRRFPIVTPGDVEDAVHSYGRAKPPIPYDTFKERLIAIARRKGDEFVKRLPESWKEELEQKDGKKTVAAKLHALLCPAVSDALLLAAYPELAKDGLAAQLGPTVRSLLYQLLVQEIAEDGGTGAECGDVKRLAVAYHDLCEFLASEALEAGLTLAARADLLRGHIPPLEPPKPVTTPAPKPVRTPEPGDFDRGPLTAGHAQPTAKADQTPRIPTPEPVTPPRREEPLEGTAAPSPASAEQRPAPGKPARVYYTNAHKDQARALFQQLHDHIAAIFPDLCPAAVTVPADADGSAETLDTRADAAPEPMKAAALEPVIQDLVTKAIARATAALETTVAELRQENEGLRAQLAALAREPDPAQAPPRNAAGLLASAAVAKAPQRSAEDAELAELRRRAAAALFAGTPADPALRYQIAQSLIEEVS